MNISQIRRGLIKLINQINHLSRRIHPAAAGTSPADRRNFSAFSEGTRSTPRRRRSVCRKSTDSRTRTGRSSFSKSPCRHCCRRRRSKARRRRRRGPWSTRRRRQRKDPAASCGGSISSILEIRSAWRRAEWWNWEAGGGERSAGRRNLAGAWPETVISWGFRADVPMRREWHRRMIGSEWRRRGESHRESSRSRGRRRRRRGRKKKKKNESGEKIETSSLSLTLHILF